MAGYFSNLSSTQSRFLANKDKDSSTTSTAMTTAPSAPPTAPTLRPRVSSKHFSTSLAEERAATKEKSPVASSTGLPSHPLRSTYVSLSRPELPYSPTRSWVFWFRQQRAPGNKITNYEEGIKKISAFSSVESFWSLWTHLHPPSSLLPTTDYLLFHSGIRRPVWEDPLNITGGKWIIRLRKGVADRIWEDLVLAIVGDQFAGDGESKADGVESWRSGAKDAAGAKEEEWPEICGCTISVRQSEDIVSVWNRVEADPKVRERIRDTIRRVLHLPSTTLMEYKSNNDSMQDKSSFRNSAIDRTPMS
ncbi:eukaryotic translation initiation factor 4E class II [Artomyces pyxidatus]|uniref:Eukaryotic translation initiation factor 4E class II n=1 Tax=Artomyces pyxidatus TaxID=48021 RepID=A0ACB8SW87_9AGAM|nr:eukaryotic translation initiation factor 4E class II [Artomyces pyxidatus]